jgi:hypothetical protein
MTFKIGVTSPELQIRVQQQQQKKDYFWTEFANYHKEYVKPAFQKERVTEMLSREHFVQNTERKVARKAQLLMTNSFLKIGKRQYLINVKTNYVILLTITANWI